MGKEPFIFYNLTDRPVNRFYGIGSLHDTPDIFRVFEKGDDPIPVIPPFLCYGGMSFTPLLVEFLQFLNSKTFRRCSINLFDALADSLPILPVNVFNGIIHNTQQFLRALHIYGQCQVDNSIADFHILTTMQSKKMRG